MNTPVSELAVLPRCSEEIEILSEASDYLLINKPAGLLSVPGRHPDNNDSVLSRMGALYPGASIIHRLDFDTSGVMVVGRTKAGHAHIARQFQERQTYKLYTAIVAGQLAQERGEIDMPIAPDKHNRPKYKVDGETGKRSVTRYRVLSYDADRDTSRLALEPVTGRSHQLRLHLASIGHPILGCVFYASPDVAARAPRLLLHATRLHFAAPHGETSVKAFAGCPF